LETYANRRSYTSKKAGDNAKLYGASGYHFPWESAFSGNDVSPNTCEAGQPDCHWKKLFVSAAVSWGIRQYYSATRDRDYMINTDYMGCDITREIARFLAERAIYNPKTARYDMFSKRDVYSQHITLTGLMKQKVSERVLIFI